jgi:hypothetical protein
MLKLIWVSDRTKPSSFSSAIVSSDAAEAELRATLAKRGLIGSAGMTAEGQSGFVEFQSRFNKAS